jgi:adenylate cyclase class IV
MYRFQVPVIVEVDIETVDNICEFLSIDISSKNFTETDHLVAKLL